MIGGIDISSLGTGIIIAVVASQVLKSATDWTVKQSIDWARSFVQSEGTSRSSMEDNERVLEIEKELRSKLSEKEESISDYERMMRSLQMDNVSKKDIIEQYWKPLPAIIITFLKDYTESDKDTKFLKQHILKQNKAEMLTGNTYAIPPKGFPNRFDSPSKVGRKEIRDWIDEDILSQQDGGKAIICQASAVDLRRVYSHSDYDSQGFGRKTIDEAIDIEKVLDENNVHRILATDNVNLSKAIENGDIAFLISRYVSEDELERIQRNKEKIRKELGDPSLRRIATTDFEDELKKVLADYIDAPESVARKTVEEAKLWHSELQS